MSSHLLLLGLALLSTIAAGSDLCEEPLIPNGEIVVVNGKKTDNFFLGDVVCNRGFERIGNPRIRLEVWSITFEMWQFITLLPVLPET